jgi:nucleotide-binding universal stress UspA family protein
VAVRDVTNLSHLRSVLQKTNMRRHDIVVMTVRQTSVGTADYHLAEHQLFTDYERELFSKVVTMAENEGKTVELLVVPSSDPFGAIVQTAQTLQASRVVTGASLRMDTGELARRIGLAWEALPEPRHAFSLEVLQPDKASFFVNLGPHPPRLWPEDVDRLHNLWLRLSQSELGSKLHHRDVVGTALRRLERDLEDPGRRDDALRDVDYEIKHH